MAKPHGRQGSYGGQTQTFWGTLLQTPAYFTHSITCSAAKDTCFPSCWDSWVEYTKQQSSLFHASASGPGLAIC